MLKTLVRKVLGDNIITILNTTKTRFSMYLYGEKAIAEFDAIMRTLKLDYWLAFGTLLGAYRENGFIKNDDDIDTAMFCNDITPRVLQKLEDKGFVFEHAILTGDNQYCQISFKYHSIPFDVYGFRKNPSDMNVITGFVPRALHGKNWAEAFELNKFKILLINMDYEGIIDTRFKSTMVSVPRNAEVFLKKHYGDDYMTPISGKKGNSKNTVREIPIENMTALIVTKEQLFERLAK